MNSLHSIQLFFNQPGIAVVGVSSNPKKFGSVCYRELKSKGYNVIPVNPKLNTFEGDKCYPSIKDIPGKPESILLVIPPEATLEVAADAIEIESKFIWFQQGSENQAAISSCLENGLAVISKECVLMYNEPVRSIHKFHRFIKKAFGRYPV